MKGSERVCYLPKVTQLIRGGTRTASQLCLLQSLFPHRLLPCPLGLPFPKSRLPCEYSVAKPSPYFLIPNHGPHHRSQIHSCFPLGPAPFLLEPCRPPLSLSLVLCISLEYAQKLVPTRSQGAP